MSQDTLVQPEVLLDGDHGIETTLEVDEKVWNEVFYFLAKNNVVYQCLKPSMVTPGAECKDRNLQTKLRNIL
ncbi:hypothetical protein L7F22_041468 [Adiantum nelumboides]|nr:hypothetical protein [Adiantum nelumboides]